MEDVSENSFWYAMRVTYCRELKVQEILSNKSIETYIPMRYEIKVINKQKKRNKVPIIHNLIFVHTTPTIIKEVKRELPYLQYIMDNRSKEKIIVPDKQMNNFIEVTSLTDKKLLYFKEEDINLSKGEKVRIIGGEFKGYEGIFVKVKGARDKRVVIAIKGIVAVAMATINPEFIEVITQN
jgi:Transcription termination factor nusG.